VTEEGVERRLTTILATDVVGYSRLMAADEVGTLTSLKAHRRELIEPKTVEYHGRVVKLMGDGTLMEFTSVVDAVNFAVDVQRAMAERNAGLPEDRRITYRVGINIGDIIVEGDDIYGDGVNIAARLEGLAEPGGICVARNVYNQVNGKVDLGFEDLGERDVKNIPNPIQVFKVLLHSPASGHVAGAATLTKRSWRWPAVTGVLVVLAFAAGVALWQRPWEPREEPASEANMAFPLPDKPSIAVLPFANMSNDPEQEYFVDGMTEDLITDLSKLSGVFVISRNTAFSYKGLSIPVQTLAHELDVRYVLEGSVRREGDRIRVNVRLIDAEHDSHIWTERYDRDLTDVFAVQDDVKREILEVLAVELSVAERSGLAEKPTDDLKAYEFYLRARQAMFEGDTRSQRLAYWALEKAIKIDPDFAEAYAGLAMTYALDFAGASSWTAWTRPPERARTSAEALAKKALRMKPALALAEMALARLRLGELRFQEALVHAGNAVAFEPGNSETYAIRARALMALGRHDEALIEIDEAFRRDPTAPLDQFETRGMIEFALRDYRAAADSLEKALDLYKVIPNWLTTAFLQAAHGYTGEPLGEKATRWAVSVSEVSLFPAFSQPGDQDHLIAGLRRAGAMEYPYPFDPSEHDAKRIKSDELARIFSARSFDAYCPRNRRETTLSFTSAGSATWQFRHDISDTSAVRIGDDEICMSFPAITRGREACFMAFRDVPGGKQPGGHDYLLVGPQFCYLSPKG
jgi:adenylate cyclase